MPTDFQKWLMLRMVWRNHFALEWQDGGFGPRVALESILFAGWGSMSLMDIKIALRPLQPYLGREHYYDMELVEKDVWWMMNLSAPIPSSVIADYDQVLLNYFNLEH